MFKIITPDLRERYGTLVSKIMSTRDGYGALFSCSLCADHEDLILFGSWPFKDTRFPQVKGQHLTVGEIEKTGG